MRRYLPVREQDLSQCEQPTRFQLVRGGDEARREAREQLSHPRPTATRWQRTIGTLAVSASGSRVTATTAHTRPNRLQPSPFLPSPSTPTLARHTAVHALRARQTGSVEFIDEHSTVQERHGASRARTRLARLASPGHSTRVRHIASRPRRTV